MSVYLTKSCSLLYYWIDFDVCLLTTGLFTKRDELAILGVEVGIRARLEHNLTFVDLIWNYISHCMTSLLKFEITVCFLAFIASSLSVTEED